MFWEDLACPHLPVSVSRMCGAPVVAPHTCAGCPHHSVSTCRGRVYAGGTWAPLNLGTCAPDQAIDLIWSWIPVGIGVSGELGVLTWPRTEKLHGEGYSVAPLRSDWRVRRWKPFLCILCGDPRLIKLTSWCSVTSCRMKWIWIFTALGHLNEDKNKGIKRKKQIKDWLYFNKVKICKII